jgi:hypothetical protein
MILIGDVDIDVVDRNKVLSELKHIPATRFENEKKLKHNTGIYVQDVPIDFETGNASFDHKTNEDATKIDIINFSVLGVFVSNDQIEKLINIEPDWSLLKDREFVENTTHIHKWFDLVKKKNINSVDKLAMFLGIIRPGKEKLRHKSWEEIEKDVWVNHHDGYFFKKSHAYGYALTIVALMNIKSGH